MVRTDWVLWRYWSALVRLITRRPESPASRLVISSVSPSAKYWSAGATRFLNGSTAITRGPAALSAADGASRRRATSAPAPVSTSTPARRAAIRQRRRSGAGPASVRDSPWGATRPDTPPPGEAPLRPGPIGADVSGAVLA